jgi:dienelactone hydrolase
MTASLLIPFQPPKTIHERLKRAAVLQHLLEIYRDPEDDKVHEVPIWEEWLARSGELPPDFDALPSHASLPDLLTFFNGSPVNSPDQWPARRAEMLELLQYFQLGSWPEHPAWAAHLVEREEYENPGCTVHRVDLLLAASQDAVEKLAYTGPASYQAAYLKIEVFIPPGAGPFPVLVGPDFRKYAGQRGSWRVPARSAVPTVYERALQRGYITCTYDQNDAFACRSVFPGFDATELVWWAWGASRCLDYLLTLPQVDPARIATAGHSRGGSVALTAAVIDPRVSAVVASHTGAGIKPFRYAGEKFGSQTLEVHTRLFPYVSHPRQRFFCGRDYKLPYDGHFLPALVAPRPLLLTVGYHDPVGELMGTQDSFLQVQKVYALLGASQRCNIGLDPGGHSLPEDAPDRWLDWLDVQFGRREGSFQNELPYTYSFPAWRAASRAAVNPLQFPEQGVASPHELPGEKQVESQPEWLEKRQEIAARVNWLLGEMPRLPAPTRFTREPIEIFDRNYTFRSAGGLVTERLEMGGDLSLYLTYQKDLYQQGAPLPAAIYCHAYCDQRGFAWERHESSGISVGEQLAYQGFMAVQYDQFGYGRRNRVDLLQYFTEHPERSGLGMMVADVQRILDALERLPDVNASRIGIVGYSLGGLVALHAAALDERLRAAALICAVGSLRLDAHGDQTEGLQRYFWMRPTLPRLGFFLGEERRIPCDLHEVMALVAPRPLLVMAPKRDQDWLPEDVQICCDAARKVYDGLGANHAFHLYQPDDFNRYPPKHQKIVNEWLKMVTFHEPERT